ncbi:glycosyltransferase [Daejeonella sp.]|uniref:glycosyltransferase n=1 Tax=Daejeonella sp. TaxID=2805397 RepID=UPI0030BDD6B7
MFRKSRLEYKELEYNSKLCIEAGINGWDSIEFKELYQSACEFLSVNKINKIIIRPGESYLSQVRNELDKFSPTHYFYDPRTGSQEKILGLWQAFRISLLLYSRSIIPIVLLTDLSVRTWRTQSAIVTAMNGIVISFMSTRLAFPIFPHRRLMGPSLMPFSENTLKLLKTLKDNITDVPPNKAVFIGSLYEPRTSQLKEISEGLEVRNLTLEIRGRVLGAKRVPDSEYWSALINSPIIVTTAGQIETADTDWAWIPQLVYRYIEAMACGTLLIAPAVPGILRYFSPGEHFASFSSTQEAIDVIEYYLQNETERSVLAERGKARANSLIVSQTFWRCVDVNLGKDSLT